MALDTYAGLKAAIQDYLDRDDLVNQVDDFIDIAEARHKRDVRIREMLSRDTLAIAEDDRYVDLPTDFLDMKYLRILNPITGSPRRYLPKLTQLTVDQLTEKSTNLKRAPCNYSVHVQIEFDSAADQAYSGEIFYYTELTALSDANENNALLIRAADVYLYAALAASAPFLLNDERVALWETLYTDGKDELNASQRNSIRSGPQISRVAGATP